MKRFWKNIPGKLWIALAAVIVFAFFSNDFGLVDIQKTAIILAAAVDTTDEGYSLTAQIAVPKGTDRTTGGTSSIEITGKGETVSACFSDIYAKTGWVPKLVFCDLLLLGERAAQENAPACLDYFLRNEYFPDSCLLAACEGSAGELLSTASAIDDASSLALEKLFSDAAEKSGRIVKTTLREFCIAHFGVGACGYMPYVRALAQETGSGQQGGENAQSARQKDAALYTAEHTALFSNGRMTGVLTGEQTFAFSLLKGKVYTGTFETDGMRLSVLSDKGHIRFHAEEAPRAELGVSLKVRLQDTADESSPAEIASGRLTPEQETRVSERVEQDLLSLWETCRAAECDLFFFARDLWRASPAQYAKWKDALPAAAAVSVRAAVKSVW